MPRAAARRRTVAARAHETGGVELAVAKCELRLVGREGGRLVLAVLDVEQDEAAGVLGLGAADEPPGRRGHEVRRLVRRNCHRAARYEDEWLLVVAGDPLLEQREDLLRLAA